jgi:uncharacterized membrane protein
MIVGFGWEQKLTMARAQYWLLAPTILLVAVSVQHYTVDVHSRRVPLETSGWSVIGFRLAEVIA